MATRRLIAAACGVLAVLAAGCTAAADRSGGTGPPRVLVMANNDLDGLVGAPAVARFVERVEQLSGGRLTVRVESAWRGGGFDESRLIRDVAAGSADLGWSGTRAFDLVGINAFQPMHAPFLVNSYAAEAAVVKDPLAGELLESLTPLGMTGLALMADELRMPAGSAKPLLTPDDFHGLAIGVFASTIQAEGLRTLGAEPRSPGADGLGSVETMWWTYETNSQYAIAPFVTANAVLWPRSVVVFANTGRLAQLDPASRGWIRQAAAEASAWSVEHAKDQQAGQIAAVCRGSARVAFATPQQLAALRSAAEPVYARLRADADLGRTLARVETLARSAGPVAPPVVPEGCAYHTGDGQVAAPPTLTGPGRTGSLPQGTYRCTLTYDELRAHEVTDPDARANAGVWTWTVAAGRWHLDVKPSRTDIPPGYGGNTCDGWYDVEGDVVHLTTVTRYPSGECAPATWAARWAPTQQGLSITLLTDLDLAYIFGGKPWRLID